MFTVDGIRTRLPTFVEMQDVADFLLNEAFRYLHRAAAHQVAAMVFRELLEEIDVPQNWQPIVLPESLDEWVVAGNTFITDEDDTLREMRLAWNAALSSVEDTHHRLGKKSEIVGIDLVGFTIFLSACVETVLNGQLLYRKEHNTLANDVHGELERANLIVKLQVLFPDDLGTNRLPYGYLKRLATLRNASVHYKEGSVGSISFKVEELFGLLRELAKLFKLAKGSPQGLAAHTEGFRSRWTK